MTVSERLVPFGYSLQNVGQLTDGSVANQVIFWETARPRGPESQDDCPIRLRSPRLYTSQLTQWNSVPRTHSLEGKVANWVYLNRRVFPRLGISLSDQTINSLVRGDRNTLISFFDMLFNALAAIPEAG